MKMRSSHFLGLSVGDRAIACAEVNVAGPDRRDVRRAATFPLADGALSPARAPETGRALAAFLKENGFAASRAVVGVPAKWLLATERDIPPANADAANAMLRLQAERLAVSETGEMVFDYVGTPDPAAARKVLLVGVPRQRLTALESLCEAADLTPVAVSSSALALACGEPGNDASGPVVVLGRQGAELVLCSHGTPRLLRHVTTPPGASGGAVGLGPLTSELARTVAMAGTNGNGARPRDLLLWDGVGLSQDQFGELAGRVGLAVKPGDPATMLRVSAGATNGHAGGGATGLATNDAEYAPAIALALAAADRRRLPLDFAKSRLAPPKVRRFSNLAIYGVAAGVAVLGALIWLYVDASRTESEAAGIDTQLKDMTAQVKTAKDSIATTTYGRGYFDKRSPVLDVLYEVTTTLRPEDPLWATTFTIKSNGSVTLQGRARNREAATEIYNRMQHNKQFGDVRIGNINQEAARGREPGSATFTISFTYKPLASSPNATTTPTTPAKR